MSLPEQLKAASEAKRERGDCTVKALAVATGCTYDACHLAMAKSGRRPRRGTSWAVIHRAANRLGFKLVRVDLPWVARCKTVITLAKHLPRGRFIADMRGHVAGCARGEVLDWSAGTRRRITGIYRAVRLRD